MLRQFLFPFLIVSLLSSCGGDDSKDQTSLPDGTGFGNSKSCSRDTVCVIVEGGTVAKMSVQTFHSDITLSITFEGSNIQFNKETSGNFNFKAGETVEFLQVSKKDPNGGASYSFEYLWNYGRSDAEPNLDFIYTLPYKEGDTYKITQGYGGTFSHTGQLEYALDFNFPIGAKILAAREGVIIRTRENFTETGTEERFKTMANVVTVLHADGSVGEYAHLEKDGVEVTVGQEVSQGDFLGYSGNTGFSTGPHLHFHVYKRVDVNTIETVPTKFRHSSSDDGDTLEVDMEYTSKFPETEEGSSFTPYN